IGTTVENKGGRAALMSKIVVDASGDGDIAYSAGAPYMQASKEDPHTMGASLMLRIGNVPPGFGVPAGSDTAVTWGPGTKLNGTDPLDITRAELDVRMKAIEFVENLRKREGFQSANLLETAFQIGIRETRRFMGEYVLTKEDAENDVRFEDAIAISSNPVPSYYGKRFFYNHLGFDVPYRCVIPKSVDGLFLAGRNISMEQAPWQSARSMAPNMAIAQATGTAAAICAKKECQPREIDAKRLRRILRDQGAVMER
ncbi:MAG: FAD-dependent oxidoreductase, partial [Candidatus Bathyarchaeota archaeon]|nr:FAD-dependent oxidoreductase [Candidatus Bathyarchaeota archaeon]